MDGVLLDHLTWYPQSSQFEGENYVAYYNGFLMANNCGLIAENGETEDPDQVSQRCHILAVQRCHILAVR